MSRYMQKYKTTIKSDQEPGMGKFNKLRQKFSKNSLSSNSANILTKSSTQDRADPNAVFSNNNNVIDFSSGSNSVASAPYSAPAPNKDRYYNKYKVNGNSSPFPIRRWILNIVYNVCRFEIWIITQRSNSWVTDAAYGLHFIHMHACNSIGVIAIIC